LLGGGVVECVVLWGGGGGGNKTFPNIFHWLEYNRFIWQILRTKLLRNIGLNLQIDCPNIFRRPPPALVV